MNQFKCMHCGTYFESQEYEKNIEGGYDVCPPDTCDDCAQYINDSYIDMMDMISDADSGL